MVVAFQAVLASSRVHRNSVPSIQMQRRITAILRATAMRAFLAPIRFTRRAPHAFKGEKRCALVSSKWAASYRQVRVNVSPHFEISALPVRLA